MKNRFALSASAAAFALALALVSGCFTVHHTEYPQVQMTSVGAEGRKLIQLSGFEATITEYIPVYGYGTSFGHDTSYVYRDHYYGGGMYSESYTTTAYLPQVIATTAFIQRAQDNLESAGYKIVGAGAQYRVEVRFEGPVVTSGDKTKTFCCLLFSLLTADYSAQTWSARLKIYNANNDLVLTGDYEQRCSAAVWGPIPIFCAAEADDTNFNNIKCWCLNALTDRAIADATAFLATAK